VLLRIVTKSFIERGADISYLSAFPGEAEVLFPPLTYLKPSGRTEEVDTGDASFTIIDVVPRM
jgi:hypothetical protein